MNTSKHSLIKFSFILLMIFLCRPLLADKAAENKNTYLEVARTQLSLAYENYNKGNISASKENLEHASRWLNMAVQHSPSDTVKSEAKKLADKIDNFRTTLNKSSEKNDLARFWHETTSLITRESEHLIHSYIEQSIQNRTVKHLLDAKMHFYTAEHDLFVSHDSSDATSELESTLEYLAEAESVAAPEVKKGIRRLVKNVNEMKAISEQNKDAWKKDALIEALDNAVKKLDMAESVASPPARMRIESIKASISALKKDTLLSSLKVKYDSIMSDLNRTIKSIN